MSDIETLKKIIREETIKAFTDQGHHLTGGWENSLQIIEQNIVSSFIIEVWGASYSKFVNFKLDKSKASFKMVPFVQDYVKKRMSISDQKMAKSIAFAIVRTWMDQGRPTFKSKIYSQTGKRTEFIEEAIKVLTDKLVPFFDQYLKTTFDKLIVDQIKDFNTVQ